MCVLRSQSVTLISVTLIVWMWYDQVTPGQAASISLIIVAGVCLKQHEFQTTCGQDNSSVTFEILVGMFT